MLPAVLAKQRDWDVLKATGRFLNDIGAKEQAANLRTALAGDYHLTGGVCIQECKHIQAVCVYLCHMCVLACLLAVHSMRKLFHVAVHGIEDLIGAVGHQPISKTMAQAGHEVKSAGGKTANTAEAFSHVVLGEHLLTQA